MLHYGDVTKIKGSEVPIVDIITFGAPCQDLSVAGKRAGMKHEALGDGETTRSGLFFEAIRIIKEMREHDRRTNTRTDEHIRPRYAVYENVPGAFSSNKGADFQAVLEETAKIVCKDAVIPMPEGGKWSPSGCVLGDGWSIAWRVHDAQFWGVPQRRKRIALVADFGGTTAPEILFERKGLSGDIEESGEERQEVAGTVGADADKARTYLNHGYSMQAIGEYKDCERASSLKSRDYKDSTDLIVGSFYPQMKAESQCWRDDGISNTLVNGTNPGFQNGICYGLDRASFNQGQNAQYDFSVEEEKAQTLVAKGPGGAAIIKQ